MKKISFYVLYKDINTGEMTPYDVMPSLYNYIYNSDNTISKKKFIIYDDKISKYRSVKSRNDLKIFILSHFRYSYWAKCEWEFIASDWPPIRNNKDKKVDVFQQLEPNVDLITDIVWEQIKNKVK